MDSPVDVIIAMYRRRHKSMAAITAEASVGVFQRRLGVTGIMLQIEQYLVPSLQRPCHVVPAFIIAYARKALIWRKL